MAEPDNGGSSSPPPQKPKELSMEKRLLLAFILMGAVLFTTPYFFKSAPPPPPVKKMETVPPKTGTATPPPASSAPSAAAAAPEEPAAGDVPVATAKKEELFTIDTNVYRITFSNKGAVVRSWLLKKYFTAGKPLELVHPACARDFPFALAGRRAPRGDPCNALVGAQP